MSDQTRYVKCGEHGKREATFVCQHLPKGQDLGFHYGYGEDNPDVLFPDAWCDGCNEIYEREGGWNERSEAEASIRVICAACYLKSRQLNWPRTTIIEEQELIENAIEYLKAKQDDLRREFRLNDHERYDWDQASAQLVFSNAGVPTIIADIQFVGSISTRTNTWMWSWANASNDEKVKSQVRDVRQYGEEHCLQKLACAYWSGTEEDGWAMTAVAAQLLSAKGAYRSPSESGFTFMVMTEVRWAQ